MAEIMTVKLEVADGYLPVKRSGSGTGPNTAEKEMGQSSYVNRLISEVPFVGKTYDEITRTGSQLSGAAAEFFGGGTAVKALMIATAALKAAKSIYNTLVDWDIKTRQGLEMQRRSKGSEYFRRGQ